MKFKIKEYDIWECGKRTDSAGNPHQEDSIYPAYGKAAPTDRLFILCDGMGGHAAGEVASATVCEALSESIMRQQPDPQGEFTDQMLLNGIADAYDQLDAKDTDIQGKKMGTTLTLLKLHAGGATIAHMGDSRVYHIRPGKDAQSTKILFVTRDHSLVNDLVRAGELTEEEARTSRQKNIITRAMQPNIDPRHKADIYHTVDIKPGDYFYLCSDGMLEQMTDENLRFNFSDMTGDNENKVKVLTQATRSNSDNHSAIIVQVTDVIDPLPIPAPAAAAAATVADTAPLMADLEETTDEAYGSAPTNVAAPVQGRPEYTAQEPKEVRMDMSPIESEPKANRSFVWIAICIVATIALGIIAWYIFLSSDKTEEVPQKGKDKIENVYEKQTKSTQKSSEPVNTEHIETTTTTGTFFEGTVPPPKPTEKGKKVTDGVKQKTDNKEGNTPAVENTGGTSQQTEITKKIDTRIPTKQKEGESTTTPQTPKTKTRTSNGPGPQQVGGSAE